MLIKLFRGQRLPDFITNIGVHLLCYCQLSHLPLKVKCSGLVKY